MSDSLSENSLELTLAKLDLIPEEQFECITESTSKTRESWRKHRKSFPAIRLGNKYYYPVSLAKRYIDELIERKYAADFSDDIL